MPDSPLVTTEWLHEHLADPNLRVVDTRGHVLPANEPLPHYFNHHGDYLHSHIPGAVFVDWVHEITDPADPRHAKIAPPERYSEVMRRIGVRDDTLVVAYDDAAGMFAARLWWSLNYYGHEQVVVLDGGWQKWMAEGRPTTDIIPEVVPSQFEARPNPALKRTADQVAAAIGAARLIDVRTREEYRGEASRAARKGHIPESINLPRGDLITAEGCMLPPDQLRERFAQIGVDEGTGEVITYCNGGVSGSFGVLALRAAGIMTGALYDGSWKEWGNDESRAIE